jgi:hypothetical protein
LKEIIWKVFKGKILLYCCLLERYRPRVHVRKPFRRILTPPSSGQKADKKSVHDIVSQKNTTRIYVNLAIFIMNVVT